MEAHHLVDFDERDCVGARQAAGHPHASSSLRAHSLHYQPIAPLLPTNPMLLPPWCSMWSIWMFTVPSLRARECNDAEKDALNLLFLAIPLLNVALPFVWKSFPFIFTADCVMMAVRAGCWGWWVGEERRGCIPSTFTADCVIMAVRAWWLMVGVEGGTGGS